VSVRKTGDWALAKRLLAAGPTKLKGSIGTALRQEAQDLRTRIVRGITEQAPGGEAFKPLAPLTLAARKLAGFGGTKALMVNADLRNAIAAIVEGDSAFVGVPRKARSRDGRSLTDVALIHEFGSDPIIIPITPRMRRFFFAMLRKSGVEPESGTGKGVVIVTIPARPFLRPAFREFAKGADRRFLERVSTLMGLGGA
jgi:hypothetical protein